MYLAGLLFSDAFHQGAIADVFGAIVVPVKETMAMAKKVNSLTAVLLLQHVYTAHIICNHQRINSFIKSDQPALKLVDPSKVLIEFTPQ